MRSLHNILNVFTLLFALLHFLEEKCIYMDYHAVCASPLSSFEKTEQFQEMWYKFYITRSIEKSVCVLIFPHYTSQI
jgi:hypothetical protein